MLVKVEGTKNGVHILLRGSHLWWGSQKNFVPPPLHTYAFPSMPALVFFSMLAIVAIRDAKATKKTHRTKGCIRIARVYAMSAYTDDGLACLNKLHM